MTVTLTQWVEALQNGTGYFDNESPARRIMLLNGKWRVVYLA